MGECGRLDQSAVVDANTVVDLVLLANTTEDADGFGDGGLVDDDLGKPTLERGILFDILAVLCEGGGADTAKLATGQEGLEQVGSIHTAAFGPAACHDQVQFINEENDASALVRGLLDFVEDGFDTLLVFALVLGTSHERAHV